MTLAHLHLWGPQICLGTLCPPAGYSSFSSPLPVIPTPLSFPVSPVNLRQAGTFLTSLGSHTHWTVSDTCRDPGVAASRRPVLGFHQTFTLPDSRSQSSSPGSGTKLVGRWFPGALAFQGSSPTEQASRNYLCGICIDLQHSFPRAVPQSLAKNV